LRAAFDFIKKHRERITQVSGAVMVLTGVLMMTGLFGKLLAKLAV
jgi:cytochrome c biogenesis protein CcdA